MIQLNGQTVDKRNMWGVNEKDLQNGVTLTLEHSFGYNQTPLIKNSFFISDDTIVYICGKHIVEYDIIKKKQTFIMKNPEDEEVTAMNYYLDLKHKDIFFALALAGSENIKPRVQVYNLDKSDHSILEHDFLNANSIIKDLCFFQKNKYILTLCKDNSQYILSVWNLKSTELLFKQNFDYEITNLQINSQIHEQITIQGPKSIQSYQYVHHMQTFELQKHSFCSRVTDEILIVDHCWIPQTNFLVVAYSDCIVELYVKNELFKQIQLSLNNKIVQQGYSSFNSSKEDTYIIDPKEHGIQISCITALQNGFVIGLQNVGVICLYEISGEDITLKGNYRPNNDSIQTIQSIEQSPDSCYLVLTMIHNQIHKNKLEIQIFNLAQVDAIKTAYIDPFEPLFEFGAHKGPILSLNVCPVKSIFITLGEDQVATFWEFGSDFKQLASFKFNEQPLCMSTHPFTNQSAVGFKDGIRFYYNLDETIKQVWLEGGKTCQAISYSDGGQFVAAGNSSSISIIQSYTYQVIFVLQGHPGIIKDLYWTDDDQTLVSLCNQGSQYTWETKNGYKNLKDFSYKHSKINIAVYDTQYDLLIFGTDDCKLKVYQQKDGQRIYVREVQEIDLETIQITAIYICKQYKCIFLGTNQGSVRVYIWPFTDFTRKKIENIEFPIHQSSVTNIQITPDNLFLITTSECGSIFISKINEFTDGLEYSPLEEARQNCNQMFKQGNIGNKIDLYLFNSLQQTSETTKEVKLDQIKELEFTITNLKGDVEDQKDKLANTYNYRIKTLEDKNFELLTNLKHNLSVKQDESEEFRQKLLLQIEDQKSEQQKIIQQLEDQNCQDLLQQYKKNDELKIQQQELTNQFDQELKQVKFQYEESINEAEAEYQKKYQDLYDKFANSLDVMKSDQGKFTEIFKQAEDEHEEYLKKTEQDLVRQLEMETKRSEELRATNSKYQKELDKFKERKIFLDNMIKDTREQIEHMKGEQSGFQEKNISMRTQLQEKEQFINRKEQQIKDSRSKNKHLQNFRSVYDYRVNSLKEEREPLLEHLENMDNHVRMMYTELLDEAQSNKKLDKKKTETSEMINELKIVVKQKQNALAVSKRKIESFQFDIQSLMKNNTFEHWNEQLQKLYEKIFLNSEQKSSNSNTEIGKKDVLLEALEKNAQATINKELLRQRDFLSKKLISQTNVNIKVENDRDEIIIKIQNANTKLIKECNFLRTQKQKQKQKLTQLQESLRQLHRFLERNNVNINDTNNQNDTTVNITLHQGSKVVSKKNVLPFVKYHENSTLTKSLNTKSMYQLKQGQSDNPLFKQLLGEIDKQNIQNSQQGLSIEKLRDKVHNYLKYDNFNDIEIQPLGNQKIHQSQTISIDERDIQYSNIPQNKYQNYKGKNQQ